MLCKGASRPSSIWRLRKNACTSSGRSLRSISSSCASLSASGLVTNSSCRFFLVNAKRRTWPAGTAAPAAGTSGRPCGGGSGTPAPPPSAPCMPARQLAPHARRRQLQGWPRSEATPWCGARGRLSEARAPRACPALELSSWVCLGDYWKAGKAAGGGPFMNTSCCAQHRVSGGRSPAQSPLSACTGRLHPCRRARQHGPAPAPWAGPTVFAICARATATARRQAPQETGMAQQQRMRPAARPIRLLAGSRGCRRGRGPPRVARRRLPAAASPTCC